MTQVFDAFHEPAQPLPPPMVKQAHVSKAPANSNDPEDFTAADFMAGMVEYAAQEGIADLVTLKGFEEARDLVATYLIRAMERKVRR